MEDLQILGEILGFQGVNCDMMPERLPPQDEPYFIKGCNNAIIRNAKIEKLKGTDYLNDVSTQLGQSSYRNILGLPIYRKYSTKAKYLIAILPRDIYYLQNDITWTDLGNITGGENDSILTYVNADDKFIFVVSDSGIIYYWDGTTFEALSLTHPLTTLKSRFVLEHRTHLVLLRTIEDGTEKYQKFWPSKPGLITIFPETNQLDLDVEGVIEGAKKLEDDIIVYFDNHIQKVYWISSAAGYGHDILADGLGLIAPKTLCGNKDIHFFLGQEGLMELLRGSVPRSISDRKFNSLILDQIDPVYYYRAVAYFYPQLNQLFLSYPKSGSTYNDIQIIYDRKTEELVSIKSLVNENYSTYEIFEKNLSGLSPDERKNYGLSFIPIIGNKEGYVKEQKINSYQDDVNNYETSLVLPPTYWKSRSKNKRCLQVDLLIEKLTNESITYILEMANEANDSFNFTYTLTGTGNKGTRRYELRSDDNGNDVDCFGKEFTIKIKDSNNPYGWNFRGAIFRGYYTTVQ